MSTPDTDTRVQELLDTIEAARDASTLPDKDKITITADGRDVIKAENLVAGVIVVYPLVRIERPGPKTYRLVWTIGVAALANDTPRANATRVVELLKILDAAGLFRTGATATPTDFTLDDTLKTTIPGFAITHTEEHY